MIRPLGALYGEIASLYKRGYSPDEIYDELDFAEYTDRHADRASAVEWIESWLLAEGIMRDASERCPHCGASVPDRERRT